MKQFVASIIVIAVVIGALLLLRENKNTVPSPAPTDRTAEEAKDEFLSNLLSFRDKAKTLNKQSHTLDMSNQGLTSFPTEILDQTTITVLNLSHNQLTSLPAEIQHLTNLEELYVEDNKLTGSLVAEIHHFKKLRILDASDNELTGIPAEIGQLKSIAVIDLSNNKLDTMPQEIINLADALDELNLSGNNYSSNSLHDIQLQLPHTNISF